MPQPGWWVNVIAGVRACGAPFEPAPAVVARHGLSGVFASYQQNVGAWGLSEGAMWAICSALLAGGACGQRHPLKWLQEKHAHTPQPRNPSCELLLLA